MGNCISCGETLRRQRAYVFASEAFRQVYTGKAVLRCTACNLSQVDVSRVRDDLLSSYYARDYRVVAGAGPAPMFPSSGISNGPRRWPGSLPSIARKAQ